MSYEVTIATGSTSLLTDRGRERFAVLLRLLKEVGIEGEVADREPSGRGVTWVEITEIWLASKALDAAVGWTFGKALDTVSDRVRRWIETKSKTASDEPIRPQSIIIRSLSDVPERRIDVDVDGNITEYRWVKVDPMDPWTAEKPPED